MQALLLKWSVLLLKEVPALLPAVLTHFEADLATGADATALSSPYVEYVAMLLRGQADGVTGGVTGGAMASASLARADWQRAADALPAFCGTVRARHPTCSLEQLRSDALLVGVDVDAGTDVAAAEDAGAML